MSIYAIEKAFWQASMNPEDAGHLGEDAESYLKNFMVDEQERALVTSWNIRGMVDLGVHPMVLMMAFSAVNGPEASREYVQRVNQPG